MINHCQCDGRQAARVVVVSERHITIRSWCLGRLLMVRDLERTDAPVYLFICGEIPLHIDHPNNRYDQYPRKDIIVGFGRYDRRWFVALPYFQDVAVGFPNAYSIEPVPSEKRAFDSLCRSPQRFFVSSLRVQV